MAKVLVSTADLPYADWLEWRKKGIGGSDASVVCGFNKYKSAVELWLEKTDQLPPQEAGESAYWGTQLEPFVKTEFTKRTGIKIIERKELLQSDERPFMLANLDGICEDKEHGTCIFEAKTASAYKSPEWEHNIPDEYMLQIQHYMAVTGYKGAYIAALIGGNNFKWHFIERDDELIEALIKVEAEFWKHIEDMTPPPLDGSEACAKFLSDKYSEVKDLCVDLPESAAAIIAEYNSLSERVKELSEKKTKAENLLKEMLGNNETGTVGLNVVSWKAISQERLDTKKLKEEHPALFKKYSTTSSYRRFSIKTN